MQTQLTYKVTKDELDLDKTLDCGQAFRWNKQLINGEYHWIGVIDGKIWVLKQLDDKIETNLSLDYTDKFIHYFNLDMIYTEVIDNLNIDRNSFTYKAYTYSKGIHILRQDLFETVVTFLMSSCNTMTNIRNIVESLCTIYGEEIKCEYKGTEIKRFSFPTLGKLKALSVEELRQCKMGFRAEYLYELCKHITDDALEQMYTLNTKDVTYKLKQYKGIGDKVANCIKLFGLHRIESFPVDTHINQIIQQEYAGKLDLKQFKDYSGVIQQYMFYYKAFNK